jgi:small subunit ribosomal protein S17
MSPQDKAHHTLSGTVISAKMDKTIAVKVERVVPHPLYGKFIRRSGTLLAHDEQNESREGDTVIVSASRPISKRKVWKLEKIVDRQK